jgi:hypothetical protein
MVSAAAPAQARRPGKVSNIRLPKMVTDLVRTNTAIGDEPLKVLRGRAVHVVLHADFAPGIHLHSQLRSFNSRQHARFREPR